MLLIEDPFDCRFSGNDRAEFAREHLALGPILVARRFSREVWLAFSSRPALPDGEFAAMYFPLDYSSSNDVKRRANDVYFVGSVVPPTFIEAQDCIALLAPYRFLTGVLPYGPIPKRLPRSIGLRVLQRYLDRVLRLDRDRLCDRQTHLAANAIRSLLAAALLPIGAKQGLASRRRASLLDRIVTHINANLCTRLSAESLCGELGLSRSALYRATAEAGGADELILNRRLTAIRDLLRNPADQRAIGEIAQAHCFSDISQFHRRFKMLFGATPGEIRRRAIDPDIADRLPCESIKRTSSRRPGRDRSCS